MSQIAPVLQKPSRLDDSEKEFYFENMGSQKTCLPFEPSQVQLTSWVEKTGIKGGEMTSISDPTFVVPSFPKLERSIPNDPSTKPLLVLIWQWLAVSQ